MPLREQAPVQKRERSDMTIRGYPVLFGPIQEHRDQKFFEEGLVAEVVALFRVAR